MTDYGAIYLTGNEIREISGGRIRFSAQARALDQLAIPYKKRPDGSLLVSRLAYEHALCGKERPTLTVAVEPYFEAMKDAS